MRKIEKEMKEAAFAIRDWSKDNTVVRVAIHAGMPVAEVLLHGHHIANVFQVRHDKVEVQVVEDTFRRWPTKTTRSRLCALGVSASIENGCACINGQPI